jgi:hypothetical protein
MVLVVLLLVTGGAKLATGHDAAFLLPSWLHYLLAIGELVLAAMLVFSWHARAAAKIIFGLDLLRQGVCGSWCSIAGLSGLHRSLSV